MVKKVILAFALLAVFGIIAMVRAAMDPPLYLPVVYNQPTLTPSPTPTPTRTPRAFPTPTPTPNVQITHVEYAPDDDPMDEYVSIKNLSSREANMTGWFLRDDSRNIFTFPSFILRGLGIVKVWTKFGNNTSTDLYWRSPVEIWNDHGDCAYLRDQDNDLIDSICYTADFGQIR